MRMQTAPAAEPASGAASPTVADVGAILDGAPFTRYLLGVVLLCAAVLVVDGYDVMVVGFVAPAIARSFGVAGSAMTPVFVLGQIGLAVGAFAAGPLADRFGRRRAIMGCTSFFGCCCLLTPLMQSVWQLAGIRMITGIGLGGILPNAIALISEMCPKRSRATTVMVMFSGFSIGSALAGLIVSLLLVRFGWQAPFIVGGLLPLLLVPVLFVFLPESVRLLALKPGREKDVSRLLSRLDPQHRRSSDTRYVSGEQSIQASPLRALFQDGRGWMTVLLWLTFFVNLLDLNLLAAWMPTYLHQFGGIAPERAASVASFYQIGGTIGTVLLGLLIDRAGAPRVLSAGYCMASIAIATMGWVEQDPTSLATALFAAGFFVVGGQTAVNAYAGSLYPTAMRSTGVAWAFGVGRFGAMLGPALGGLMLAQGWSAEPTFILAALPIMIAIVSVLLVGRMRPAHG